MSLISQIIGLRIRSFARRVNKRDLGIPDAVYADRRFEYSRAGVREIELFLSDLQPHWHTLDKIVQSKIVTRFGCYFGETVRRSALPHARLRWLLYTTAAAHADELRAEGLWLGNRFVLQDDLGTQILPLALVLDYVSNPEAPGLQFSSDLLQTIQSAYDGGVRS